MAPHNIVHPHTHTHTRIHTAKERHVSLRPCLCTHNREGCPTSHIPCTFLCLSVCLCLCPGNGPVVPGHSKPAHRQQFHVALQRAVRVFLPGGAQCAQPSPVPYCLCAATTLSLHSWLCDCSSNCHCNCYCNCHCNCFASQCEPCHTSVSRLCVLALVYIQETPCFGIGAVEMLIALLFV